MSTNDSELAKELINKIKVGKAYLFLGAGASINCSIPSTSQLIEELQTRFPNAEKSNDLSLMCENIEFTVGYGWPEIYKFIQTKLGGHKPSNAHKTLSHYDWGAIFTTNYDDLVEKAYSLEDRFKPLKTIVSPINDFNPLDRGVCHYFKLNGTMLKNHDEEGHMMLTKTQLMGIINEHERLYNILLDILKDGTLFFIGYSFRDFLALNIIQRAIKRYGQNNISYSYALFPDKNRLNASEIQRLNEYRIIVLEYDFESFFEYLSTQFDHRTLTYDYMNDITLQVSDTKIIIPFKEAEIYRNHFIILCEETIQKYQGINKESFFQGKDSSWKPYIDHWDFERFFYSKSQLDISVNDGNLQHFNGLKDYVFNTLNSRNLIDYSKILVEVGIPGIGKSTMARRLAYDCYKKGIPVILLENNPRRFDIHAILKFMNKIVHENKKKSILSSKQKETSFLIIADNFADWMNQLQTLKDIAQYDEIFALIVGFEREGVWNKFKKVIKRDIQQDMDELPSIAKEFHPNEKKTLIKHLQSLAVIGSDSIDIEDIIIEEETFFGLMYSLVSPSKIRFDEIIRNQYSSLRPKAREVFSIICFFHQFDLKINYEFLARICEINSWHELVDEIILGEASGIIVEETDLYNNLFYRTNHRIIAQKTVEFFFSDPLEQMNMYIKIFSKANKDFKIEQDLCERLIIDYLSRYKDNISYLNFVELDKIFETLCTTIPSSALYHHWALITKDMKDWKKSYKNLENAETFYFQEKEHSTPREKLGYIYTTWGNIFANEGLEYLKKNDSIKAERLLENAVKKFEAAIYEDCSDAITYNAYAVMNFKKAEFTKDNNEKINSFKQTLEILDKAMSNTDPTEHGIFETLMLEVQFKLRNDMESIEKQSQRLYQKYNDISGYYVLSRALISKASEEVVKEKKIKIAKKALQVTEDTLLLKPNDTSLLKTRIDVYEKFFPEKLIEEIFYHKLLSEYYKNDSQPYFDLAFKYACLSFKLGYYQDSKKAFNDLRRKMRGLRYRIKLNDIDNKVYKGRVTRIVDIKLGYITSEDPIVRSPISFSPTQNSQYLGTGDLVRFEVQFSTFGPKAINIKKL